MRKITSGILCLILLISAISIRPVVAEDPELQNQEETNEVLEETKEKTEETIEEKIENAVEEEIEEIIDKVIPNEETQEKIEEVIDKVIPDEETQEKIEEKIDEKIEELENTDPEEIQQELEDFSKFFDIEYLEGYIQNNDYFEVVYDGQSKNPINIAITPEGQEYLDELNAQICFEIKKIAEDTSLAEAVEEAIEPGHYSITPIIKYISGEVEEFSETIIEKIGEQITLYIEEKKKDSNITYNYSKVYDGKEFEPVITISGEDVEDYIAVKDTDYTLQNLRMHLLQSKVNQAIEPGAYEIDVVWNQERLAELKSIYEIPTEFEEDLYEDGTCYGFTITFYIEQIEVEFAGWYFDESGVNYSSIGATIASFDASFDWEIDAEGNLKMLYNGFSPLMALTEDNDYPLPQAKFVLASDHTTEVEDITRGISGDYIISQDLMDDTMLITTLNAGTHDVYFAFLPTSHYKTSTCGSYTIIAREIKVEFDNTAVSSDSLDKRPTCNYYLVDYDSEGKEILTPGLAGLDDYLFFKVAYTYYDEDGNQLLLQPQEEGLYRAKVEYLAYADGLIRNNNYIVLNAGIETNYVVGKYPYEINPYVSVSSVNNSSLEESKIISVISEDEIKGLFESDLVPQELKDAYANNQHINLYLSFEDTSAERISEMKLANKNSIIADVRLYASIDSDVTCKKYEISETNFDIYFILCLNQDQIDQIEYNSSNKNLYVSMYHNDSVKSEYDKLVYPATTTNEDTTTYAIYLSSNRFSDFAIYSKDKPTYTPDNRRVVPITRA